MRILTVIGNRPQFVKAAAVSKPLRRQCEEILIHTGQHYDQELSRVFFDELELPKPDHHLSIGGGTNSEQTARMISALEPLMRAEAPDAVLVYGDTNSTLAGGLVAAQLGIPVAHVEAGMRSFDRSMPEELNRVLTDHLSSLLLCSTKGAAEHLAAERVAGRIEVVGDVMADVAQMVAPQIQGRTELLDELGVTKGQYLLVTAHRCGNVDTKERLQQLVTLLTELPEATVFPLHPRTHSRLQTFGLLAALEEAPQIRLTPPLGYLDFMALILNARTVMTDSGGVQKEAYFAGVPCITLRPTTEWVETVHAGWNILVDLNKDEALQALHREKPHDRPDLYGDGKAGERVSKALAKMISRPQENTPFLVTGNKGGERVAAVA